MSFEYGSQTLGIKNPFRFEGIVMAVLGLSVTMLGVILLFSIGQQVAEGNKIQAWLSMGVGALLLLFGIFSLGKGAFRFFRFFVGRSVPASLAYNLNNGSDNSGEMSYTPDLVDDMLMGRKNLTFIEPKGWFSRMVHSIFPKLLYMPYPVRNTAQSMMQGMVYTLLAFICFGITWFSGYTQLTDISNTPAIDWLIVIMTGYLVLVWMKQVRYVKKRLLISRMDSVGAWNIAVAILAAIVLSVALSYYHANIQKLPELPFEGHTAALFITIGFSIVVFSSIMTMVFGRVSSANPETTVSEYRNNWQENVHPREVFVNFESIIMADRRYKEIPNRIYKAFDPKLIEEGSNDKGSFGGKVLQETQPVYRQLPVSSLFKALRMGNTVASGVLLTIAAFLLYNGIELFAVKENQNLNTVINFVFYPVLFWVFGRLLYNAAHVFWSEIQFESTAVLFKCEGTYAESKLSTGASIHDSNRSENVVVRSSMTPWIIVSKLITTTFSEPGQQNLEQQRYIMEMHSDDKECDSIISEMKAFLGSRQTIANVSEKDLEASSRIMSVNAQAQAYKNGQRLMSIPEQTSDMALENHQDLDANSDVNNTDRDI